MCATIQTTASPIIESRDFFRSIASYLELAEALNIGTSSKTLYRQLRANDYASLTTAFKAATGLTTLDPQKSIRTHFRIFKTLVKCGCPPFLMEPLGGLVKARVLFNKIPRLIIDSERDPSLLTAAPIARGLIRRLPYPRANRPIDFLAPANITTIGDALRARINQNLSSVDYRPFIAIRFEAYIERAKATRVALCYSESQRRAQALQAADQIPPLLGVEVFTLHPSTPDTWITVTIDDQQLGDPIIFPADRPVHILQESPQLVRLMTDKLSRLITRQPVGYCTQPRDQILGKAPDFYVESRAKTFPDNEVEQPIVRLPADK